MCRILNNLRGRTPEEILRQYETNKTIPVNLEDIVRNIGISVIPKDFSRLENKYKGLDIQGFLVTTGDNAAIYYKESDDAYNIRVTVAHELGHCCNLTNEHDIPHVELRSKFKDDNEKEMDRFASKLLIPTDRLTEVYMSLPVPKTDILARKFKVPTSFMEFRLNDIKVSHFTEEGKMVVYD